MKRYLKNTDLAPKYMKEETLKRLTNNLEEHRLFDAEKDAVSLVLSHLTNNFEIEEELALGRSIEVQNTQKEYKAGSHLYDGGRYFRVAKTVTPSVRPDAASFWTKLDVRPFSETETYLANTTYYRSEGEEVYKLVDAAGEVSTLDSLAWELVEVFEYSGDENYLTGEIVECDSGYYECRRNNGSLSNNRVNPSYTVAFVEAVPSGVVPEAYDRNKVYRRVDGFNGYVTLENKTYFLSEANEPKANPDTRQSLPEKFELVSDPRNGNIVRCVAALATYGLYQAQVPDNIPSTTIREEEKMMDFLKDSSKLRINPLLKRKMNASGKRTNAGWVIYASEGDKKKWHY